MTCQPADMPKAAATACPDASDAALRLLFLLDITGSMSEELDACRGALGQMVAMCSSELQAYAGLLSFAVITFTECDEAGCFTSLFESTSPEAAKAHVDGIKLCEPPGHPGVNASGSDGPENHKAALARTTELDASIPTIAFLITDAPPHLHSSHSSPTAQHELDHLAATYPSLISPSDARDCFKTVRKTALAHFGPHLCLNCVVYNQNGLSAPQPSRVQLLYASLAAQAGGMLMQPESRDAAALAAGLISVVKALMSRLTSGGQQGIEDSGAAAGGRLQGFRLIDLSGVPADRQSEDEREGQVAYGDTDALFAIAMDRMVAVCGTKWSKRAIGMTTPTEQLQFVWRAGRYIHLCTQPTPDDPAAAAQLAQAKSQELAKLVQLRGVVVEALPAASKGHFSMDEQVLLELGQEAAAWAAGGGAGGAVSAVSLEGVGEALQDDAELDDHLHLVMKLVLGYPINVQLPLDAFGQPDLMDAWSAVLVRMGVDTTSAADFMQLISDCPAMAGLTDKEAYNAFLIAPHPDDKLASLIFKVASGTQVLDFATSVLVGGNRGCFLPNLHAGITAACLTQLLSRTPTLTDFRWCQVQQLAHTLCIRRTNAAKGVTRQLLKGQANPEDNASKLLLGLLRLYRAPEAELGSEGAAGHGSSVDHEQQLREAALRAVLQEWLGSMVQRHYGKQTPENNARYLDAVLTYLPVSNMFDSTTGTGAGGFDPLQQLSPLETTDPNNLGAGGDSTPDGIRPDWQQRVLQRLLGSQPDTPAHPVLGQFVLAAGRLLALLLPADSPAGAAAQAAVKEAAASDGSLGVSIPERLPSATAALDSCWPGWRQAAIEALLLRVRTARYTLQVQEPEQQPEAGAAVPAAKPQWEAAPVSSCLVLAVQRLQEALAGQLKGYRQARLEAARAKFLKAAAALVLQHAADPDRACEALQQLPAAGEGDSAAAAAGEGDSAAAAAGEGVVAGKAAGAGPVASLLNVTYSMQRTDVPALLELLGASMSPQQEQQQEKEVVVGQEQGQLGAGGAAGSAAAAEKAAGGVEPGAVTPVLLHMLVAGPWCTQGPQVFRRSLLVLQLCWHMGSEAAETLAAITAREVCCREVGHNRHGHSASLPYPGPDGWTEEYEAARLAAVAVKKERVQIRVRAVLQAMKRYTAVVAWARETAAGDAVKLPAINVLVSEYQDARMHPNLLRCFKHLLGMTMPAA